MGIKFSTGTIDYALIGKLLVGLNTTTTTITTMNNNNNNNSNENDDISKTTPYDLLSAFGATLLLVRLCSWEKYLGKGKDVYFAFLDLEKAYDRVDRDAMWNVLRLYGIGGRLLRGVKSLYVGSKACVRVGNEVSEWFPVRVGLRQGCVMSPWLFNLYIDGVAREVNA